MHSSSVLSVLAAAGLAAAQCSTGGTLTIQNSGDASQLASCQTFSGSIAIATQTTDDIALDGINTITGDLTVKDANNISSISADSLQSIKGTFMLDGVRALTSLSFPQLSSVSKITWATLPNLGGLSFDTGVQTADEVSITDTDLASLDGIDLQSVDKLVLQSNQYLTKVGLALTHFSDELFVIANGQDMSLSMPNLKSGKNFNLQNLGSLDISSLEGVNGTFFIESNTFTSLEADKLQDVQETLTISKNSKLSKFSMSKLETLNGGIVISSCPQITKIDGLDALSTVHGNIDFSGNFDSFELPKLSLVQGAFNVQSTGPINGDCKPFLAEAGKSGVIRGKPTCKSTNNPTGLKGSGSDGSGTDGSGGDGDGAAGSVLPSLAMVGGAAIMAVLF